MPKLYYAVAILAATAVFFLTIRAYGSAEYKRGWSEGELKARNDLIIGEEELDAIADNKPDDAMLILQLRTGEFFPTGP